MTRERVREAQRLEKLLEDAGIELSSVASDILGASARAMLAALIAGERDPQALAALKNPRLRATRGALPEALRGNFTANHATMARLMLTRIDHITATIAALDAEVDREVAPFAEQRDLSSRAGMCPGNNECAGKHHSGKTRKGDPWLRGVLGGITTTAARSGTSHLGERCRLAELHALDYQATLHPTWLTQPAPATDDSLRLVGQRRWLRTQPEVSSADARPAVGAAAPPPDERGEEPA